MKPTPVLLLAALTLWVLGKVRNEKEEEEEEEEENTRENDKLNSGFTGNKLWEAWTPSCTMYFPLMPVVSPQ